MKTVCAISFSYSSIAKLIAAGRNVVALAIPINCIPVPLQGYTKFHKCSHQTNHAIIALEVVVLEYFSPFDGHYSGS